MQNAYVKINSLEDMQFIAGTDYTLIFEAYDESGDPLDVSSSTFLWKLCPYGRKDVLSVSIDGAFVEGNKFSVSIEPDDTATLEGGVYIQQPIIIDSLGKTYIPAQGIVTIVEKIADS